MVKLPTPILVDLGNHSFEFFDEIYSLTELKKWVVATYGQILKLVYLFIGIFA